MLCQDILGPGVWLLPSGKVVRVNGRDYSRGLAAVLNNPGTCVPVHVVRRRRRRRKSALCCSKSTPAPYEKAQTSEEMIYMQAVRSSRQLGTEDPCVARTSQPRHIAKERAAAGYETKPLSFTYALI